MSDRAGEPAPASGRGEIACPACGFAPLVGMQWVCAPDGCGGLFDTFATRGQCPHCEARFTWTMCPSCGKTAAHRAWYRAAG